MKSARLKKHYMEQNLKVQVSRYMSYLLRHNPENLKMDRHGFVDMDELMEKLRKHFEIDRKFVSAIVEKGDRKRFEIVEDKIRALYGHTIPVKIELEEDRVVKVLFHGTTPEAASRILKEGLKPMKRRRVHLSPTVEIATEVGLRRAKYPVVLEIDAEAARKKGLRFFMATDKVYVCSSIPPRYVCIAANAKEG